jgi:PAS domain-containing protein
MTTSGAASAPDAGPDLADLRQRKRTLDAVVVLTIALAITAAAVPWFLRVSNLDFAPAVRGAFLLALGYAAAAAATDRLRSRRGLAAALALLQVAGVVALALLWHLVGGVEIPMFLLAFFLPVAGAAMLVPGWPSFAIALLSVASAVVVAVAESPGLRFDLAQMGLPLEPVLRFLPAARTAAGGFGPASRPSDPLVALIAFALLLPAFAAVARVVARSSRALESRTRAALAVLDPADNLFGAVARASGEPAVLVLADSGQVVRASETFRERMLLHGEDLPGRDVFDLVRFLEPAKVRVLLAKGGELPFCFYDVGREPRVARLRVDAVSHRGARYANLVLHELIDLFYLKAALDGTGEPLLLIGPDERLRYFNLAASRLFGDLHFGQEAGPLLGEGDWRADARPPAARRVQLGGRSYSAVAVEVRTPETVEPLTILRLLPANAA